ncbi:replication-relaxation family protein [Corallococcus terminator]|uniref:replication-relaxation family protein n=1 Tax=Corallococcus terminator TaxID=2316733 RepID=UPI00131534FB|nr:replication-relaxation family protein [Corallococcus terminator]
MQRLQGRLPDGHPCPAWALDDAGWRIASNLLGAVKKSHDTVKPQHIAHALATSEFLVGLLELGLAPEPGRFPAVASGKRGSFATATDERLRWLSSETSHRPWSEYNQRTNAQEPRALRPDAILELLHAKVRVFVECEMGTHTIASSLEDAAGTTVSKLNRYASFMTTGTAASAGPVQTFYAQHFPDRFAPHLLLLVQTSARQRSVEKVVSEWAAEWRRANPSGLPLDVRVRLTPEAVAEYGALLPGASAGVPSGPSPLTLTTTEADAVVRFYRSVNATFKELREAARKEGRDPPPYPVGSQEVFALSERIREQSPARQQQSAAASRPAVAR